MKIPNNLVSRKQSLKLKQLGFDQLCSHHIMYTLERRPIRGKRFNCLCTSYPANWNKYEQFASVPTVYEAIDWLCTKLKAAKTVTAIDYIGYIYLCPSTAERYKELRLLIDDKIKLLINDRKSSLKRKKQKRLSKSWKQTKNQIRVITQDG